MTWNFRIIFHDGDDYPWYGIHEVFYNDDNTIRAYTIDAMDLTGETTEFLISYVDMVQKDINRLPILVKSEIVLVDDDEDNENENRQI